MAFQYQPSTLEGWVQYAAQAFASGQGLEISLNPADGTITGLVAIEPGSDFAHWVAERAERRASTLNV